MTTDSVAIVMRKAPYGTVYTAEVVVTAAALVGHECNGFPSLRKFVRLAA